MNKLRENFSKVERLTNEILAGKLINPEDVPEELMGNLSYYIKREYSGEIYEGTFGEEAARRAMKFRSRMREYARSAGIPLKSSMLSVDNHVLKLYELVSLLIEHANDYDDLTEYNRLYSELIEEINSINGSDRAEEVLNAFDLYIDSDEKFTENPKGAESSKFVNLVRKGLDRRIKNKEFKPEGRASDLKYSFMAAFSSSSVGKQAGFITKQICLTVLGGALVVGALSGPVTWASIFGLVTAGICGVGVYRGFEEAPKFLKPNIHFPKFAPTNLFGRIKQFVDDFANGIGENLAEKSERREEKRKFDKLSRKDNKGKKTSIRTLGRVSDYDENIIYESCAQEVLDFADREFSDGKELAIAVQMINNRLANQLSRLPKGQLRSDYYSLTAKFQKMCETKSKKLGKGKNGRVQVKNFKSYLTREKGKFYIAGRGEKERYSGWKVNSFIDNKKIAKGVQGRDRFYDGLIDAAEYSTRRRGR